MRDRWAAVLVTAIGALLSLVATYATLRAYDVFFRSEANPATIVWSAHIAMFWRLGVGAFVAGGLAPVFYLTARRDLASAVRVLAICVPIVGTLIAVQGALLP
jgi:hypothetical protein